MTPTDTTPALRYALLLVTAFAKLGLGLGLLVLAGCTDPYQPDVLKSPPSYLVVDGFLNAQGITTIKLSHTNAIGSKTAAPVETKATLYIEDESGTRVLLREAPVGTYTSDFTSLNTARKYRLHINTLAGKEYVSGYVPAKITPPIDAVNWRAENSGLNIYVSAHDDTNTTQYYRWETDETWEITPPYRPSVEYVNRAMRNIVAPYPTLCWGNARSTVVHLENTTALSHDVVTDLRLQQLPPGSERLHTRYSLLVQQHALTKEEYDYWTLLRKNTESIGSLFDAQPTQLTGNVRCLTSPADVAIGYIGAHSLAEKRIFIRRTELPNIWYVPSGYESCVPPDTVNLYPSVKNPPSPAEIMQSTFGVPGGFYVPINPLYAPASTLVVAYTSKNTDCIDCRTRGSSVKPSYWP